MGTIIIFPPSRRAQLKRREAPASHQADILFFTGVRYARRDAQPSSDGPRPRKADGRSRRRKASRA